MIVEMNPLSNDCAESVETPVVKVRKIRGGGAKWKKPKKKGVRYTRLGSEISSAVSELGVIVSVAVGPYASVVVRRIVIG